VKSGPRPGTAPGGKRERLIAAAQRMLHEHGAEKTTLAEIAADAGVPLGNVYYYFKTKDALVSAVLDSLGQTYDVVSAELDEHATPADRLKALIGFWVGRRDRLARFGCPVGSLSSELDKRDDALHDQAAVVMSKLIVWAQAQFQAMGRPDARELAVALVAAYQGIAVVGNTLRDPALIAAEGDRLTRWIDELAASA
jgi:TetR/AcrR family transcriptional repressor of nem operon